MKMFSQVNSIVLMLVVSLLSANALKDAGEVKEDQFNYRKINEYLESKVGASASSADYLEAAHQWLRQQDSRQSLTLMNSLNLFLSLGELEQVDTCNSKGYEILHNNNLALTSLARYGLRAIDRVALDIGQKHAIVCCQQYPQQFELMKTKIVPETFRRVQVFAEAITEHALERNEYPLSFKATKLEEILEHLDNPINYIRLMDSENWLRKRNRCAETRVLLEVLEELSGEKLARDNVELIERLYKEYLTEPCEYYAKSIGAQLYLPLELDEITRLDSRGKVPNCGAGSGKMEFKLALAYHKVCQMYVLTSDANRISPSATVYRGED